MAMAAAPSLPHKHDLRATSSASARQAHRTATNRKGVASRVRCEAQAVSAPKREKEPKKRAVITGMGLVSVFGNDVNTFYDKLLEGTSGIDTIDRFDISKFPTKFAGQIRGFSTDGYIDGKNDRRLDVSLRGW